MSSNSRFPSRIRHVQPGDPVAAGVTSSPDRTLEERSNYLKSALELIDEQRAHIHREAAIAPEVLVGQPVYWNPANHRYEQAFAEIENDNETHTLVESASAGVLGLCYEKLSDTSANIVLHGLVKFSSLINVIDGTVTPGRYYLSSAEPGKLVAQRPAITVFVGYVYGPLTSCEEDVWIYILPQTWDVAGAHTHFRIELTALPAGDTFQPASDTGAHTIVNADAAQEGWLPANHASFGGRAPEGAKFGYNLAAHPALERVWPPMPLSAAVMYWDKADGIGGTEIPTELDGRLVTLDRYGIWWMSDCYGDVPWPLELVTSSSASNSELATPETECPRAERMRLIIAFLHMAFAASKTVVTSLQPLNENQPIRYLDCDGNEATTGDLYTRIDLSLIVDDEEYYGGQVVKEVLSDGAELGRGWVAEGLIAGSDRVALSGSRQRRRTPGDATTPLVHQGLVTIDVDVDPTERAFPAQIVQLNDVDQRNVDGVLYLGFPANKDSEIRLRFAIPFLGLPTSPQFKLRATMFADAAGPFPEFVVSYYRIARPVSGSPVALGDGDTAVDFPTETASIGLAADSVIEVESEAFDIAAGDTVFVTVSRAADATPELDAEVGMIRVDGIVVAAEAEA